MTSTTHFSMTGHRENCLTNAMATTHPLRDTVLRRLRHYVRTIWRPNGVLVLLSLPQVRQTAHNKTAPLQTCDSTRSTMVQVRLADDQPIYIEPEAFAVAGRRLLLAGSPSYVWQRTPSGSKLKAQNAFLGVIVGSSGRSRPVFTPRAGQNPAHVRALGRPSGTWAVVFMDSSSS